MVEEYIAPRIETESSSSNFSVIIAPLIVGSTTNNLRQKQELANDYSLLKFTTEVLSVTKCQNAHHTKY